MSSGRTADAEQLLKEAVRNNPKNQDYLVRLAYHYGSVGRRDDMINVLQEIKSRAKEFEDAYRIVGNFYLRSGDPEAALREYREGITKDSKNKAAYQHLIIDVLMRQGKRAEAAEVNAQILKENPKDMEAKTLKAKFWLDSGDIANALTELQGVVAADPTNPSAHYELGRAYLASNRAESRESARQQFEKAISLRPDMISPRLGLAQLQVASGEYQAGLDSVQVVLNVDPNNLGAKLIQSQGLLGLKKYGESDSVVATMLKSNPSSPDIYYQKGVNELQQGKAKDAETDFVRAYQLNPTNAKGLMGIVDSEIQQGKPEAAMQMLATESKKAPNRMDIVYLMGLTAQREGKYNDALAYFTQVLNGMDKKSKTRANLYMEIANNYRLAGDRDGAISNYMKARDIIPDNETVLSALGLVLDQANRKPEARQAYEAALRVGPNNAFVLNNLAYLMAESGTDMDVALSYAQKAKSLDPNKAEISDTLGWILLKKGLFEQAIPVFKGLSTQYPQMSTYHYHLAMAYQQKGDVAKTTDELREALKHTPPPDEQRKIQEMLSRVGAR
jgi:tetratricopeptide (TPR) repeat protein